MKYPALKKIPLMTYNAGKNLTPLYVMEKKISNSREVWRKILPGQKSPISHSLTNVQWSCQPFRGWGKKRIWHLCKCHPSTKWLARDHDVVVFKTKVLHFKIENTPIKDTNGKRKFNGILSFFLWTNESFSLWNCLSKNSACFYTVDRSAWLVLNQPIKAARILKKLEVHSVLCGQRVACEPQTHFRSSLLSFRKIASANPSDKTISVT